MDIEKILIETGDMTPSEARVYIALLKLGESKVGQVILQTNMQSSVVHNAINSLIHKGFISFILKNKIKHYFSTNPHKIQEYIELKKVKFETILTELDAIKSKSFISSPQVEIFSGKKGMMTACLKLFKNANKGDVQKYFGVTTDILNEDIIDFFKILETRRKASNLIVKGIANVNAKNQLKDYNYSQLRFTSLKIPPAMSIFQNRILLLTFSSKFTAIFIESDELAKQYHKLWDSIWELSK